MAILTAVLTLFALPVAFLLWTAQSIAQNRAKAKSIGLPYVTRWISPINPFWLLYGSSIIRFCTRLGIATEDFQRIYSFGWEANERANIHVDKGEVFIMVHPGGLELCVSNAEAIYDILQRRTEFRRNMEEIAVLNVYGKNLATTDDQEWQQHRKMTGVTFTEKNNELVWEQSLDQALGMLQYWTQRAELPIRTTHQHTKVFTLNFIASALFNKVYGFEGHSEMKGKDHTADTSHQYRDSLATILESIIQIWILGEERLKSWWTPVSCKQGAIAMSNFRSYIDGLMDEERAFIREGKSNNQHLVARLVQACEEDQALKNAVSKSNKKITLTQEEILSNLFVYAFAGNETTSIALMNLLTHLAANPQTQEWISKEINHYLPTDTPHTWSYEAYPKLKRCDAVVTTGSNPAPLKVNGTVFTIPADTPVHCSLPALHTLPKYWGPNPLKWNPNRFISLKSSESTPLGQGFANETLAADTSEYFMPFAWGQRVYPGKRFAQVELVAALAVLFKDWRIRPDLGTGETDEQARKRIWETSLITDHEGHMLHEMLEPEKVGLR
ncbi:hypothetical protein HYALB_00010066 [Hymenoscyphus albidus]|uniref:Cytochrome P450 monooxygenase n=1 Tax=Hymenoscyphus albidus TaxID=595503 RepID=A0A9N9PXI3_9HELO|nr:hypothetical protein HYALB_00010066 [Hymenoscyphus albidus]